MRNSKLVRALAVLAFGLAVAGCSKKEPGSANQAGSESVAPAAPAPTRPANPAQAQAEQEVPYQVHDLQLSVEAYEKIKKRKLASLDQLVSEGFLTALPPAPPGKRFALDPATARVSVVPR